MIAPRKFRALFLFAGSGYGAAGFEEARARLGADGAQFVNCGGIDIDPMGCEDFRRLTGGPALVGNLSGEWDRKHWPTSPPVTPEVLRAFCPESPDVVFTSPPCKGHSGLLSQEQASTEKYQEMNSLVHKGLFLICETWERPPGLIVLENVPRVASRGAEWLMQVRQLLASYGYRFHEESHDLRKIGNLGAHRRRYLLVARHEERVPAYVFRPPLHRGRSCGDVLASLPLPEEPAAGPMHRLPRLSLLNWIRLALIPPGGDWRDLPDRDGMTARARAALNHKPRRGAYKVTDPEEPADTIRGRADVRTGPAAVADDRLPLTHARDGRFADQYRLREWGEPAGCVTGSTDVQEGAPLVADPRVLEQLAPGATGANAGDYQDRPGYMGLADWNKPARTITGKAAFSESSGVGAVADPRIAADKDRGGGAFGVTPWAGPAATVCGESYPSNGSASVADPRIALGNKGPAFNDILKIGEWDEPAPAITGAHKPHGGSAIADPRVALGCAGQNTRHNLLHVDEWHDPARTVTGATRPGGGAASVADPRLALGCTPRETSGSYGVRPWDAPAYAVTGSACIDNGAFAVADARPRFGNCDRVTAWDAPTQTVTHAPAPSSGGAAAADPRLTAATALPPNYRRLTLEQALSMLAAGEELPRDVVPVIESKDGTWHRPLTDLELSALQGIWSMPDGAPLALAGRSRAKWRERIGNAVPKYAALAIGATLLQALLAAALGNWSLSATGYWVREDGEGEELDAEEAQFAHAQEVARVA